MYRKELPRIYELHDLLGEPPPPTAYFHNLDQSLSEEPQKLYQFRKLEEELSGLDPCAWSFLKSEVKPLLTQKHRHRGWQSLFDKLNEAKGYNYLTRSGYERVRFIPRSSLRNQMTPDLEAYRGSERVLCEVKTINISKIEAERRSSGGVGTIKDQLDQGFFDKLAAVLTKAECQMAAYDADAAVKIAYVIIKFDDLLHEYASRYGDQIRRYLAENPKPGLEVVLDWYPPFDTARVD